MENNNYNDEFSLSNIKHTIIYIINNYHKFLLLLLVILIIYFVDYITYINALIYGTPQVIPGLTSLTPPPPKDKQFPYLKQKNKNKKIRTKK